MLKMDKLIIKNKTFSILIVQKNNPINSEDLGLNNANSRCDFTFYTLQWQY